MKKVSIVLLLIVMAISLVAARRNFNNRQLPNTNMDLNIDTNEIKKTQTYDFLDKVNEEQKQDYIELNDKYIGKEVEYQLIDTDTGKEVNISDIEGIKIIALYSAYCNTCKLESPFISNNFKEADKVTFLMTSQEKDTNGTKIMKEAGYELPLYYFGQDIPNEVYSLYNLGRPGYLIIDENNKIMFLTAGYLSQDTYQQIFEPIKDLLPQQITEAEIDNDSDICTSCE